MRVPAVELWRPRSDLEPSASLNAGGGDRVLRRQPEEGTGQEADLQEPRVRPARRVWRHRGVPRHARRRHGPCLAEIH